jgi:hypothetical protein
VLSRPQNPLSKNVVVIPITQRLLRFSQEFGGCFVENAALSRLVEMKEKKKEIEKEKKLVM